jgi:hypothetical protein
LFLTLPWIIIGVLKVALFVDIFEILASWFWHDVNNIVVLDIGVAKLHVFAFIALPTHGWECTGPLMKFY